MPKNIVPTADQLAELYNELDRVEQYEFQNLIDWDYDIHHSLEFAEGVYEIYW
jgi:hypothetical protein